MNGNLFHILRLLFNRHVTTTPIRVLREQQKKGKPRLPAAQRKEISSGKRPGVRSLQLIRRWLRSEKITRHKGRWVINSFLPPFPSRAFNRMFENQLSNRRLSPVSAYLAVTSACPYNCWHCSLKNRRAGHLDTAQWLDIIAQLHDVGCSVMGFTGGEPLCRQDLPHLIEAASRGGAETILYTCGAMINDEWIERLKQAGLWSICVSYDHPDPAIFDQKRGKPGAAQAAEQAIRLSARHGFYTMIGSVATRKFVAEKHYKLLLNKAKSMGVHEFRIVEPMPCGKLSQASRDTFLTADMIQELRDFHVRANKRLGGPKVCAFNQIESPELFGCGGGTQHMFIDPAGEVTPCDFTPLSFGNLREEKLEVVWLRMVEAMGGAPRRHCFIQKNHQLIDKHGNGHTFPLPREISQAICEEAGQEELPDYFQMLLSAKQKP